jgi:hypothetical protein
MNKEELNFYYSREKFLAKQPARIRAIIEERAAVAGANAASKKLLLRSRFNLIRPLIDTPPKAVMFVTIGVLCIVIFILSAL